MKLRTVLLVSGLALAAFAPAPPASAQALGVQMASAAEIEPLNVLNPVITVRSATIKVSDVFSGPIPKGDRAILNAPAPGERMVLDADLLGRIARLYELDWKPLSRDIRAVVKRDARTVGESEILDAVRAALVAEGAPRNAELIPATAGFGVQLPAEAVPSVSVGQAAYDPHSQRFSTVVDITATANDRVVYTRQVAIAGRAFATEALPVLSTTLNRGDIISANDITVANVRADRVAESAITDPYALVGKQVRRQIKEGEPVRANQLQTPILVDRGDEVVIFYALKTMNLTAKGKALDAGGQGDVIRILNTKSNRTLLAKIVQPHQVVVDVIPTQTALR